MNIEYGNGPIMAFLDIGPEEPGDGGAPLPHGKEYYRKREQAERAAAKKSPSVLARRIHQELAEAYAQLVRKGRKS